MEESILNTIKLMVGVDVDYDAFDVQIITHVNSALSRLGQLGVGPREGFRITGATETWEDFVPGRRDLEQVKDYVHLVTRIRFDPPTSAAVLQAYKEDIDKLEFCLNVQVD